MYSRCQSVRRTYTDSTEYLYYTTAVGRPNDEIRNQDELFSGTFVSEQEQGSSAFRDDPLTRTRRNNNKC